MGIIKSFLWLTLIGGAIFSFYGPSSRIQGGGPKNTTVLETSQITTLDEKFSDRSTAVAIASYSSKAYIAGKAGKSYPSDMQEDFQGLKPLKSSVFQEVFMIGGEETHDLSRFSIKKFDGQKLKELASFSGSSMSYVADISKGKQNIFIAYNKKRSINKPKLKSYILIYNLESRGIESKVRIKRLSRAETVIAGDNSFYVASNGKISKYSVNGERVWQTELGYPDLTKGSPSPILDKKGDSIFLATTVSNGHNEIVVAKFTSNGGKSWSRKIDVKGLNEKVTAVEVSDEGLLVASASEFVKSIEPFLASPKDVVFKKLSLSSGSTEWTQIYDLPEDSREDVQSLKSSEDAFKALLKVKEVTDVDLRKRSRVNKESSNAIMALSSSGNITKVVYTKNYSAGMIFMLDSVYGIKGKEISRLTKTSALANPERSRYYLKEIYKQKASKKSNDWYQKLRDTQLDLEAYNSKGKLFLRITNTGGRTISTGNFGIYYGIPKFLPVKYRILKMQSDSDLLLKNKGNQCLTGNTELAKGESLSCLTGFKYPQEKTVQIRIMAENFDYEKSLKVR